MHVQFEADNSRNPDLVLLRPPLSSTSQDPLLYAATPRTSSLSVFLLGRLLLHDILRPIAALLDYVTTSSARIPRRHPSSPPLDTVHGLHFNTRASDQHAVGGGQGRPMGPEKELEPHGCWSVSLVA